MPAKHDLNENMESAELKFVYWKFSGKLREIMLTISDDEG